jgi:hypothetical protein
MLKPHLNHRHEGLPAGRADFALSLRELIARQRGGGQSN